MKLLIGSRALRNYGEKYLSDARRTWDWDWIAPYEDFERNKEAFRDSIKKIIPLNRGKTIAIFRNGGDGKELIEEFEIAWEDSTAEELLQIVSGKEHLARPSSFTTSSSGSASDPDFFEASPDVIFTLKKSHRYLKDSPHFLKTMKDYRHLRDKCGCKIPDELKDWYKKRVKETYWYKHPNLNVEKKDFFKDDGVPYLVEHDDIHESVKHFDKPAYCYYLKDNEEVQCDKERFLNCSREIQLAGVVEEACVLAIERSLLPSGAWGPERAWKFALMKVCTSICSGWFREFAYENYFDVLKQYPKNYWEKFQKDLSTGLVRRL